MSSDGIGSGDNVIGVRTVYDAVLRLEGKVDQTSSRLEAQLDAHREAIDTEVATVKSDLTYLRGRIDGSLGLLKWLGPAGVAGIVLAAAKSAGLL